MFEAQSDSSGLSDIPNQKSTVLQSKAHDRQPVVKRQVDLAAILLLARGTNLASVFYNPFTYTISPLCFCLVESWSWQYKVETR